MRSKSNRRGSVRLAMAAGLCRLLPLVPLVVGSATGCDGPGSATPPAAASVPEPTEALRPEAVVGSIPERSRVADYVLNARYDEDLHQIDGRARIEWRNHGPGPVQQLPFHLYMNGFRAADTAWMRQAQGSHRANGQDPQHPWGYTDVRTVQRLGPATSDGEPQRAELGFAESSEPSLMTVQLDTPLQPGDSISLELSFVTQLPGVFARTGFAGRYVMAGQWFPKIGVRDPDGQWKVHPFTLYSEFYADFGDYDVTLDLPADLTVGASGIRLSHEVEGTRQRLHYRAQSVHDFAWTAGPDLFETSEDYEGIRIRALLPQEHAADAEAHLEAQRAALRSMEARFGPYPWSTITLVQPPKEASGAGGMEYPTFYTTTPVRHLPGFARRLGFDHRLGGTFTSIHEFGHQYFQGLIASDEFTQPWLDEGLNTFSNLLVLIDEYGDDGGDGPWIVRFAGHPVSIYDGLRMQLMVTESIQPIDQPADHFTPAVGAYGPVTYRKTAATMLTLRRLAGAEAFDRAMRTYTERFRFAHPTGADLERTLIEGLGEQIPVGQTEDGQPIAVSLPRLFDQALRSTATVDFRVHKVQNRHWSTDAGWHRDEHGLLQGGDTPLPEPPPEGWPDDQLEAIVVVHRKGDFVVPVDVEVEFSDGQRERVTWDGTGRYRVLRWPGRRVVWASVDPDGDLVLEAHRHDNTRYARFSAPSVTVHDTLGSMAEISAMALGGALGP